MPKTVNVHPSERIDKIDFEALASSARSEAASAAQRELLDSRDRIIDGFRVEILDQSQFPGRITIHNGMALDYSGNAVINEDQVTASRTIMLDGANTTFYVEIEFNDAASDVDARAFWDPTVDQGLDTSGDELPDGQETSANVATRKTPDWKVVIPISTVGFTRDQPGTLNSNRIPLVKLRTNGSNVINSTVNTNLVTEKASTVITRAISTTQVVLKHPRLFAAGQAINVTDSSGTQFSAITSVNYTTGLAVISAISLPDAGAIVRVTTSSAPDFVKPDVSGSYRRYEADAPQPNHVVAWQDRMYQGDEVYGRILSQGHSNFNERDDVNLSSLKDYVDFLAGQLQEMKWGSRDPFVSGVDSSRTPPGVAVAFPTTPRYFDNAGSIIGSRMAAVTVGDGINSRGDFNGTTQAALQAAHNALPAAGGRIFLKRGTYTLTSDLNWTNVGAVTLEGEEGSVIEINGGKINVVTTGDVVIKTLTIKEAIASVSAQTGLSISGANPAHVIIRDTRFWDCSFDIDAFIPWTAKFDNLEFNAVSANMATRPLIRATGVGCVLSGTWNGCSLAHASFNLAQASLIDLKYGVALALAQVLEFVDCVLTSGLSAINLESIHLGSAIDNVQFTRVKFLSFATFCHIRVTGGRGLKLNECVNGDVIASILQATDTSHVEVDACVSANDILGVKGTAFPAIDLVNCSNAKVTNCNIWVNAGLVLSYPSNAGIKITTSGPTDVTDVVIKGNTVIAYTDYVTGVMLDMNVGYIRRVRIVDNYLEECAVGIAMLDTGGTNGYEDISIRGNQIKDTEGGLVAAFQKLGIYGAATATFDKINIIANHIYNCNPDSAVALVGGTTRQGIIIKGSMVRSVISENEIENIGHSTTLTNYCAGIWVSNVQNVAMKGNVIQGVWADQEAVGIQLGEPPDLAQRCSITGNVIHDINADTGSAWGIHFYRVLESTFTGNVIGAVSTSSGTYTAAFGLVEAAAGRVSETTFTGNRYSTIDSTGRMFLFRLSKLFRVSIVGNESSGGYLTGDETTGLYAYFLEVVTSVVGDRIWHLSVKDNIAHRCSSGNVFIQAGSGDARHIGISGNEFHVESGRNIEIDTAIFVRINNNDLYNTGGGGVGVRNVYLSTAVGRVIIDHNVCSVAPGSGVNIFLNGASTSVYQINHNICERSGDIVYSAIDTRTASGTGVAYGNLLDTALNWWTTEAGVTAGAVHEVGY